MRVCAVIVATLAAMTIIGLGSKTAFADTTNNAGKVQPQQSTQYVTVQEGDYLSGIAASYQTDYVRLFDANSQIVDPDLIYPGEVLRIPSATEQLPNRPLPTPAPIATYDSSSTNSNYQSVPVAQSSPVSAPAISDGTVWDSLAQCESGGNWSIDTGNGFYGGLQFTLSSWQAVGGSGYPNQSSRDEQIMRAEILQSKQGWGAWPVCSAKLGL